jgi:SAM-dependent methyltransferase
MPAAPPPLAGSPPGTATAARCWVCGCARLEPVGRPGVDRGALEPALFRITDAGYGRTLPLARCRECGFVQIADDLDPTPFYARMEDPAFDVLRPFRALQARELVGPPPAGAPGARLLDVGAGSGALVEEALRLGWDAEGVEPSASLAAAGRARGLVLHEGTLPLPGLRPPYEEVTLVDVVEHVTDPRALVAEIRPLLRPGGRLLVVTPDVESLAARLLGRRWWHYRVAHVGYFRPDTLDALLATSGFVLEHRRSPAWYFPLDYLWTRVATLLPFLPTSALPASLAKRTVRLQLGDSIAATYRAPTP